MGKHYSVQNWIRYKNELSREEDANPETKDIGFYYPYVVQIAHSFPKSAQAIGSLDILDLIQAGNLGLWEAWQKVDLERGQAEVWAYLKTRIKFAIRQEINKYANMIKIPDRMIRDASKNLTAHEKILVNVFPQFFENELLVEPEEVEPWISFQLEELITDELNNRVKNRDHIDILLKFYGIGFPQMSQKELAERYKITASNVQKIIERTRNKLKTKEFENIIENFYQNES